MTDAAFGLGESLTASEARDVAVRLEGKQTLTAALGPIPSHRSASVRALIEQLGGTGERQRVVAVLRAVAGAKSQPVAMSSVWTVPATALELGELTSSVVHLVEAAHTSIMCATYNFTGTSMLWAALRDASEERLVAVTAYLDGAVSGQNAKTPAEVKAHLARASVWRSRTVDGKHVTSHAKFVVVDERFVFTTSANFSLAAEQHNVEFGLRVDDPALATQITDQMHRLRGTIYEEVER